MLAGIEQGWGNGVQHSLIGATLGKQENSECVIVLRIIKIVICQQNWMESVGPKSGLSDDEFTAG